MIAKKSWPPYCAGAMLGLLQIPLVYFINQPLGGSTSLLCMLAQGFVGPLKGVSPFIAKFRTGFTYWWQVLELFLCPPECCSNTGRSDVYLISQVKKRYVMGLLKVLYTTPPPPGRPVHPNAISTSLGSIQPLCNYCTKTIRSYIHLSVPRYRYSFIYRWVNCSNVVIHNAKTAHNLLFGPVSCC